MAYKTTVIATSGKRSPGSTFDAPTAEAAIQWHKSNLGYNHGDMILAVNDGDDTDRATCEPCFVEECYRRQPIER